MKVPKYDGQQNKLTMTSDPTGQQLSEKKLRWVQNKAKAASTSTDDGAAISDELFQSIASKTSALMSPQVTLTCYIPAKTKSAVIGRKGTTIAQIQKQAQLAGNGPVRVSIVGQEPEDGDMSSVPYTYSELDWSSPYWTPVVIRADPCAALAAAQQLEDLVDELDEVIMDVPISRMKHASLIGKRGVVLANLSADTQVRIMVPRRDLRHDVIQLEGDLEKVKLCLEKVLTILSDKRKNNITNPRPAAEKTTDDPMTGLVTVATLPSMNKLRNVSRKTETIIKRKKMGDEWQLIITGPSKEQVDTAVAIFEKWNEETKSSNAGDTAEPSSAPQVATQNRNRNRGRPQSRANEKSVKGKKPQAAT